MKGKIMRAKNRLLNTNFSPTNRRLLTVFLSCLATLVLFLMPMTFVSVTTAQKSADNLATAPTAIIYDNGPLATGTLARNGTSTAPAGTQWSEASWDFGDNTTSNTLSGVGCQVIGAATANRCADDFNVPVGQTWTINQVIGFAYQTGSVANPIIGANLRIWLGRPGDPGSTIIFGDTSTNRIGTVTDAGLYRIFNSGPPGNTATGTTRIIRQVPILVSPAAVLTAGNYWVDFQFDGGASGNFSPPTTITGTRGVPGWNARQFIGPPTNTGWADSFDDGSPVTAANINCDFPFKLDGSISGAPATPASRRLDFNGDNKSDLAVARATGAGAQATWYILNSVGASSATPWGVGVGFGGADRATPEDFDGDGKTDIAVWRTDASAAHFYILQSSNGALRTEQFGRQGDDPTVVDDYDGDGKADVAVFRNTDATTNPCGGINAGVWYWRPSGTPATNFAYKCWGGSSDKAYPGDFDGDGKADFSIVRNVAGEGNVIQSLSGGGARTVIFGVSTDRYISGDYDADGRQDIAVVRQVGPIMTWYVINSGNGQSFSFQLGDSVNDYNVPGDYDGDNKTDFALWRSGTGASSGDFYLLKTFTSPLETHWGSSAASSTAPDFPVGAYQAH